ncbi:MAG TPA: hypothetical protein VF006_20345 [Longimicrobium sp.]
MGQSVAARAFFSGRCAHIKSLLGILGALLLSGCDAVVDPPAAAGEQASVFASQAPHSRRPVPPMLEAATPRYPAAVIYILYREYLHRNPGLTSLSPDDPKYQHYVERRLRELYPRRGYAGMMQEAVAEARRNQAAWRRYERDVREYERGGLAPADCDTEMMTILSSPASCLPDPVEEEPDPYADPLVDASWDGQAEFAVPADSVIPTIPMEIDTLQLEGVEVDTIYYYESLATGTFREPIQMTSAGDGPSIDDRIRAAGGGSLSAEDGVTVQVLPQLVFDGLVSLAVIGWKAHRAMQATNRARAVSAEYYPFLGYSDTRRDAMRHIYWNMMLRRYVDAFWAREIADWHERGSTGAPRVMDLHNNAVGRWYRYERFRGHWLWDRWNWKKWGSRVRDYIYFSSDNAVFIPEWANSVTTEQAWQREASVPDTRYIYFR